MDWSIQEVARLAGTTSRTLRHYDDIALLPPSRVGQNGYRYYDQSALVRLQRILMLRELGLGLPAIAEVLAGEQDDAAALRSHLSWLRAEQQRLDRQIASVERTIGTVERNEEVMAEEMLDGFDHTQYRAEVEQRWGTQAYADSDRWWRGLTVQGRQDFLDEGSAIAAGYAATREAGRDAADDDVQALVARHCDWIAAGWGGKRPTADQVVGLAEMYVADERFAAYYGGVEGASFVRDAMMVYALEHLP